MTPSFAAQITGKRRQAVIVIHGIGEPRPMNTLRAFVDAVVDHAPSSGTDDDGPAVYSRPDAFSDSFELRRLVTRDSRSRTEFFELYWAHRMPVANWSRIFEWLKLLIFRRRSAIPKKFRGLWLLSWIIFTMVALCAVASIAFFAFPSLRPAIFPDGAIAWPVGLILISLILQGLILSYIGDAAIYLSSHPRNIEARHVIRSAGISLLERLHASNEYDRIVIVGHSLGSVIGYDILTHAWQRFHEQHGREDAPSHDALKSAERLASKLNRGGFVSDSDVIGWRQVSLRVWQEQHNAGCPWLVTDFITLGSPLAHADLLLANSPADFGGERSSENCRPALPRWKRAAHFPMRSIINPFQTSRVLHLSSTMQPVLL